MLHNLRGDTDANWKSKRVSILLILLIATLHNTLGRKYTDKQLDEWEPPEEIEKQFPSYFIGNDKKEQPVFVIEIGKWPFRNYLEKGDFSTETKLDKYMEYILYRWSKMASKFRSGTGKFGTIVDCKELKFSELASVQAVRFIINSLARRFQTDFPDSMDYVYVINANLVSLTLINLARPVLGETYRKFNISGSNKKVWIPKLRKMIPMETLPPWYGGNKRDDYKPSAVIG